MKFYVLENGYFDGGKKFKYVKIFSIVNTIFYNVAQKQKKKKNYLKKPFE